MKLLCQKIYLLYIHDWHYRFSAGNPDGGSRLIEKHLEHSLSESFYQEAVSIASNETVTHNISSYNLDTIQESLTSIAIAQDTEIWILNNQNEIIVNTDKTASNFPAPVKSFDPTAWGGSYYQIGDFYWFFLFPKAERDRPHHS